METRGQRRITHSTVTLKRSTSDNFGNDAVAGVLGAGTPWGGEDTEASAGALAAGAMGVLSTR